MHGKAGSLKREGQSRKASERGMSTRKRGYEPGLVLFFVTRYSLPVSRYSLLVIRYSLLVARYPLSVASLELLGGYGSNVNDW